MFGWAFGRFLNVLSRGKCVKNGDNPTIHPTPSDFAPTSKICIFADDGVCPDPAGVPQLAPMRYINEIIIHCSDSPWRRNDTAADIDRWHRDRGFRKIGYHYVIDLDGTVERGRRISEIGAHCKRHNAHSIGICYIGGRGADGSFQDTRTDAQRAALLKLVTNLVQMYHCPIYGHRDFAAKACPCFDANQEFQGIFEKFRFPQEKK